MFHNILFFLSFSYVFFFILNDSVILFCLSFSYCEGSVADASTSTTPFVFVKEMHQKCHHSSGEKRKNTTAFSWLVIRVESKYVTPKELASLHVLVGTEILN